MIITLFEVLQLVVRSTIRSQTQGSGHSTIIDMWATCLESLLFFHSCQVIEAAMGGSNLPSTPQNNPSSINHQIVCISHRARCNQITNRAIDIVLDIVADDFN